MRAQESQSAFSGIHRVGVRSVKNFIYLDLDPSRKTTSKPMKNKHLFLLPATIAAGFNLLAPALHAAAITWDAGGANNNWSTVNNWSDNAAATDDDVTFNATGALASGTTNTVDESISIASLSYNFESATLQHTTNIAAGQTLGVTGNFSVLTGTAPAAPTNVTFTGSTGILDVTGNSFLLANQTASTTNSTTSVDMSALGTLTANLTGAGSIFRLGGGGAAGATTGNAVTLRLATDSTITASTVGVSDNSNFSTVQKMLLGSGTNTINTNALRVGSSSGGRGAGEISFNTGTGTLLLRGLDGVAAVTTMNMVNASVNTSNNLTSVVNLNGHNVDAKITNLTMARRTGTANSANGFVSQATLSFDQGTLEVGPVIMGANVNASLIGKIGATINIGGGTASFGAITMADNTAGNTTKTITAALNLTGGTTTVTGNIVKLGTTNAFATLALSGATTVLDMTGKNLTGLTSITYTDGLLKSLGTVNTGITLAGTGSRVFEQATGISGVIQGAITGTGLGLTKQGVGALNLAGANTYDGQTAITAGRLQFAKQASLYNNTAENWTAANLNVKSGATLGFNVGGTDEFTTGNVTTLLTNLAVSSGANDGMNAGSIIGFDTTNATGGTFTIGDVIADTTGAGGGTRGLTKFGANSLVLTNDNTFTGNVTIATGELKITANGNLGTGPKIINAQNNAYLTLDGTSGNIALASDLSITTAGLSIVNSAGDNIIHGTVKTIAGNGSSSIRSDAGSLNLAGNVDSGATGNRLLELSGTSTDANTISGSVSNGTATLAITKSGTGTWELSNATNSYTGATNVNGGKLVVNGNISTSSLTTVASGATLAGSGTVGKTVINGTLAVGNSPGQMDFTDTLVLAGTTVMEIDGTLGAGVTGGHDFVNLTGAGAAGVLTYGGAMTLDIGVIFGTGTYSWNLFDMASETGTFATLSLGDQYSGSLMDADLNGIWDLTSGDNTWQFTESTGELGLTVIPEPSAALLGGVGVLALLRRRRSC
jgi:autotransporter-associated beta strand protein